MICALLDSGEEQVLMQMFQDSPAGDTAVWEGEAGPGLRNDPGSCRAEATGQYSQRICPGNVLWGLGWGNERSWEMGEVNGEKW